MRSSSTSFRSGGSNPSGLSSPSKAPSSHRPSPRPRGRDPQAVQFVLASACRTQVENLEQRQLLSANPGWTAAYFANTNAGTDGAPPAYVFNDQGGASSGKVVDKFNAKAVNSALAMFQGVTAASDGSINPFAVAPDNNTSFQEPNEPPPLAAAGAPTTWNPSQPTAPGKNFSIRYDGVITAPEAGNYTFVVRSDDGEEMFIDGQMVTNTLTAGRGQTDDTSPALSWTAGSTHTISVLYQNGGGGWAVDLGWKDDGNIHDSSDSSKPELVPITAVSQPAGPVALTATKGSSGTTLNYSSYTTSQTAVAGNSISYTITRNGTQIGTQTGNSYVDASAPANRINTYTVGVTGAASTSYAVGNGEGFSAQYFQNDISAGSNADNNVQDHAATYGRIDPTVNISGSGTGVQPAGLPASFGGGNFSVRWDANVVAPTSGTYTFFPSTDDNERFSITDTDVTGATEQVLYTGTGSAAGKTGQGDFIKDAGRGQTEDPVVVPFPFIAGHTYHIHMDMNQGGGGWAAQLRWAGPGVAKDFVPAIDAVPLTPAAPAASSATGGNKSVILNFSLPLANYLSSTGAEQSVTADSFNVYRAPDVNGQPGTYGTTPVGSVASPALLNSASQTFTFTDTGLANSTTYHYIIKAVLDGTEGPASADISAKTVAQAPAAPNATAVRNADGTVTLSFATPFATSYTVARSTNGTSFTALTAGTNITSSTFTDSTANGTTQYYYQVTASNDAGAGPASLRVFVATGDGFAATYYPNNNLGGSAQADPNISGQQTWVDGPVSDGTNGTTSTYQTIDKTINFTGDETVRPPSTPTTFNSARTDGKGPGYGFSTEWDFTVEPQYDGTYTFFPSTDDGNQLYVDGVRIDGTPGDHNLPGLQGITESVDVVPGAAWVAGSTHTVRLLMGQGFGGWDAHLRWSSGGNNSANPNANPGQPYQLVPAFEAFADVPTPLFGAPGNAASPTAPTSPSAPAVTPTPNNQAVRLDWTSVQADSYQVYRSTVAPTAGNPATYGTLVTTVAGTPGTQPGTGTYNYTDSGNQLTNGTTYYYTVVPLVNNPAGGAAPVQGSATTVQAVPVVTAPAAPTISSVTIGNLVSPEKLGGPLPTSNVTVTWSSVPFATSYDVYRAPHGTNTFQPVGTNITGTTYTDSTAPVGQVSDYEVVARNSADPTGTPAGSTSAPASADLAHGATEAYYANSTNWGGANDNAHTMITGVVGNPSQSSVQPTINFPNSGATVIPPGGTQGTNYSTIFTGKVNITQAGTYTFASATDDDGLLYVDGTLVATDSVNTGTGTLTLNPGAYNFQFFQEQGGGGHYFIMSYNGPDTNNQTVVVPQSALTALTGAPAAATAVTVNSTTLNSDNSTATVSLSFTDNATNELEYQIQRSSTPNFSVGTVTTVSTIGLNDNGAPDSTTGAPGAPTVNVTDPSAPAGNNYYRVVAINFEGSATSAPSAAAVVTPASNSGVEAHFYNNEWWRSVDNNTNAVANSGVNSAVSPTTLTADVGTTVSTIDGSGTDPATPAAGVSATNYSSVFTGQVQIFTGGTYTFSSVTDDDGYLYVDDQLVSADPGAHGIHNPPPILHPITLPAGPHNFEFFQSNGGGGWDFHMYYKGADTQTDPNDATTAQNVIVGSVTPPADTGGTPVLTTVSLPVVTPAALAAASPAGQPANVNLTWNANNVSAVRYIVQRSTVPFASATDANITTFDVGLQSLAVGATGYSFTDPNRSPGNTYYYRIAAQNYDGTSAYSPQVSVALPITLTADQDVNGKIQVSFPALNSTPTSSYALTRTDTFNGSSTSAALTTINTVPGQAAYGYTDAGPFTAGHTYTYTVTPQGGTAVTSNGVFYVSGTPSAANHPTGFSGATDLSINTNSTTAAPTFTPTITANGQLQLTATVNSTATSVYETTPVTINGNFNTSFDFQLNTPGADGFTFVIQNQGATALGGSGGGFGYTGVGVPATGTNSPASLALAFNMFSNITQVSLGNNGAVGTAVDMSTTLGNAFHNLTNGNTDVLQASISLDASGDNTASGAVIHLVVRDPNTGLGFANDFHLPQGALAASSLFGPNSHDYIGFTAATGGVNANQYVNDWTFRQALAVAPPTIVSVTPEDAAGNGVAAGSAAKGQRSIITQVAVVFSEKVNLTASALTLGLVNNYGSGTNDTTGNTPNTLLSGVLGAPSNPSGDGITWIIPILSNGTNSYALKGTNGGMSGASLNDGVYQLGVAASGVTAVGGPAMASDYLSPAFHRLFGDTDNARRDFNVEYAALSSAFSPAFAASNPNYNPDVDYEGDGRVFNSDYAQLSNRFGPGRIFSEPQS